MISLYTATISTAIVAALGIPLAYLLAHGRAALTRPLTALIALPLALPPLISGLLLLYLVGPYTTLGRLLGANLTDSTVGIVLAQTFVAAPFLVIVARAAFASVDPELENVAATLGHGRTARFRLVALPAALPGVAAGLLLCWLRAFGEFGATLILAYHPYTLPVFTFVQFNGTGLPGTMLPTAVALGAALFVLLLVQLPLPRRRHRAPAPGAPRPPVPRSPALLDFAVSRQLGGFTLETAHRASGARLAILGSSGAGKTLTLRLIAGLSPNARGHVEVGGDRVDRVRTERRGIGYVPQQPALLPRRSVWRQVTLGARCDDTLAHLWIERLGLIGLEDRYPEELSGGQQRRVSLARALANQPRLLLLDEPFTGLDAPVRRRMARELRRLQRESGMSTVIVTHDPEEAAILADEIIVIGAGRVLQSGTPRELFGQPRSPEVAALLGIENSHVGTVLDDATIVCDGVEIAAPTEGMEPGAPVGWAVDPERIALSADGLYAARVIDVIELGRRRELTLRVGSLELAVRGDQLHADVEDAVMLDIPADHISVWALGG
ncbi:MAG: transporter related [Solirubrobacterales bacterium]|nr:transporter related [Solirubrobacterales bacterium]